MRVTDVYLAQKLIYKAVNATNRGIPFSLSFKKLKSIHKADKCQFTGVPFSRDKEHPHYPTIDRIDNTKGYTDDNVILCTKIFNSMKDKFTTSQLSFMASKIKQLDKKTRK